MSEGTPSKQGALGGTLVCVGVTAESHDVKSFHFKWDHGGTFIYSAGQFITLELDIDGAAVRRCYTLSSSPGHASPSKTAAITVKAKPGGQVSNWLHANMAPGVRVRAQPPAGAFCISSSQPEKYLFVAGGVGITPVISMARWLSAHSRPDICFVQCARTEDDFLFGMDLGKMASGVRVHLLPNQSRREWSGASGLISPAYLSGICPDWAERQIYCCGPDGFMRCVRDLALQAGADRRNYHEERFTVEPLQEPPGRIEQTDQTASLYLRLSDRRVADTRGQTILQAAWEAGVQIPASCEVGICGTCKVKKHAGEVNLQHQGGISDEEVDAGWVLACCSYPVSPVEIDA